MDAASVLVLNQNYEPLNVCNVRRALILVLRGKAEVIESARSVFHTARATFVLPSVIRLVHMIKRPRPKVRLSRKEIFARDGWRCVYCGRVTRDLTLDHVLPRHRGGPHTWENLVAACRACNHRKSDRTPEQAHMPLLYTPYVPSLWEDFILRNRRILADQMEFLMTHLPKSSRVMA